MSISRRDFLKSTAASSALLAIGHRAGFAYARNEDVEEWVKGVCCFCGTGCGVLIGVKDGRAVAVKGDPQSHNKGFLCTKGTLMVPIIYAKERATQPLIRKKGELVPASWEEALDLTASRFKEAIQEHGPGSVGYYGSGQTYIEETYLASKIFKAGLRSNNVDGNSRLCMASAADGYLTTFGADEPCGSYDDIDAATCIFIIGSNTSECHPILFERVAARKEADPSVKVIVADPRRTNTARIADIHMSPNPETDLALLNSIAQVIIEEEIDDRRFHSRYASFMEGEGEQKTFEEYREFLKNYEPEKVSALVGVPAATIRRAAVIFAESSASLSLWCAGINQQIQGVWANNLIHNLHLLTGHLGRAGATPLSLAGQANACGGARDAGGLSHLLPGGRSIENQEHRNQLEEAWGIPKDSLDPEPGHHAISMFDALAGGRLKTLLVHCTDPAQSLPNLNKYREAMARKDNFIALIESFLDAQTVQFADVVLPSSFWCETEGVLGCSERRYALVSKAIEPPGECRAGVDILVDLARRLGVDPRLVPYRSSADIWDECRRVARSTPYDFWGITRDRLREESGIRWPCPTPDHPGTRIRYVRGEDPNVPSDHSQKYFFYGKPLGKAVIWLRPYRGATEKPDAGYPFVLTTGRVIDHWQTGTMTMKVLELQRSSPRAYLEINQKDAGKLGIRNGDQVELETRRDKMILEAKVGEVCREGLVFVPWFDAERLVNKLTLDAVDDDSGQPELKICAARVRKV